MIDDDLAAEKAKEEIQTDQGKKKKEINWRQAFAGALVGAIIGSGVSILLNRGIGEWQRKSAATNTACSLVKEVRRNQEVVNDVLSYINQTVPMVFYKPAYADEFERHLRMIEGRTFNRALFAAQSQEVANLSSDLSRHVYALYTLMELAEQQQVRILREVRASAKPDECIEYLAVLRGSYLPLKEAFSKTIGEMENSCGSPEP